MTNKVTAPRALGIKCPYTGEVIDVYLTVGPSGVLYNCPNAFTPSEPVATLPELQDRASMRNGVRGSVDGAINPKCAYTGKKLFLQMLPDGRFMYKGGFNPRRAFTDLDELLYWLTMRDGVATRELPAGLAPVESVREPPKERADARITPSDATLETMENLAAAHMERGTMVSMSVQDGKGEGKGKGKGKGEGKGGQGKGKGK